MKKWEGTKNVRIPDILRTLPNFLVFLEIIWPPPTSNEPIETSSKPYEVPKIFKKFKEVKKWEGTKNVRNSHIFCTLPKFLVFWGLGFFRDHLTTS